MIDPLDCCNYAQLKCRVRLAEAEARFRFVSGVFVGFLLGGVVMVGVELIVVFLG